MRWTHEFRVGLFALAAIMVITYMFFVLSPDMFQSRSENNYYTVTDDASGIVAKTQVKTSGVVIGKVQSVQLQGNQSRIDFSIRSDIKIPVGSEMVIKEKGLLGDVFLEVIRGDDKGKYLKNGDYVPPSSDQASIAKLVTVANSIGKDIKKMTSSLADVLGGEEGRKNISKIVNDVRDVADMLKGILSENREHIKKIVANFEHTTNALDSVISGQRTDLKEIVTNIRVITESIREVLRPENRAKVDRILVALDTSMDSFKSITQKVNSGQGTLGRLVTDDKAIDEIEGALKDLRSVIAPAKKMQVAVDFHAEYKGNSRTQPFLSVILQPRPDKYYLLGISDVTASEEDVFFEALPPKPGEARPDATKAERWHKSKVARSNIRFDVQYAQRWGFSQLRFGLFQSTGGVAGDFFLLDDKIRYSFEAFDWRQTSIRNVARLKTYVSILFFNHLYAMLGADDLTRRDPVTGHRAKPEYFVGAGFNFTDEDLKGLFGLSALAH